MVQGNVTLPPTSCTALQVGSSPGRMGVSTSQIGLCVRSFSQDSCLRHCQARCSAAEHLAGSNVDCPWRSCRQVFDSFVRLTFLRGVWSVV